MSRKSEAIVMVGIGAGFGAVIGGCSGALAGDAVDRSSNGAVAAYYDETVVDSAFLDQRGSEIANYPAVENAALAVRESMQARYGYLCIDSLVGRADGFAFNVPELSTDETISIVFSSPACAGQITDSAAIEDFGRFLPTEGYIKYFNYPNEIIMHGNAIAALELDSEHDGWKRGMFLGASILATLSACAFARNY
jgi:hypothetical protein